MLWVVLWKCWAVHDDSCALKCFDNLIIFGIYMILESCIPLDDYALLCKKQKAIL